MKRRTMPIALSLLMITAVMLVPAALAAKPTSTVAVPIEGTIDLPNDEVGRFVGTFNLQRLAVQNGNLVAIGTLTGNLFDSAGGLIGSVTNVPIAMPVSASGTCEILFLQLGPIDLDLLGLVVELEQVTLTITAEQGEGKLLGNLLCAVAGLLDRPGGNLQGVANLLNRIIRLV